MEIKELKFILKLTGKPDYRSPIAQIKPSEKIKAGERDKICRDLKDRGLVDCDEEIVKINITGAGKSLLKIDTDSLPATARLSQEKQKILQSCQTEITPLSKINISPAKVRHELVRNLIDQGLIVAGDKKIKDVWLTESGKEYLALEYTPSGGGNIQLGKQMLADYLHFIRKYISLPHEKQSNEDETSVTLDKDNKNDEPNGSGPTDEKILQMIKDLDREKGTDNYLPIYHLREKLQTLLSRDQLNDALYRLQRGNKIDLSSIVEAGDYTEEQIEAGIPQNAGGCLFFLKIPKSQLN
ncbi:MAG: hypothetical protein N5P05_002510 [Chroococcopsis gigantea SAG 12.99]|jgi:hypothetical protein|nr:hypothetical protein [Chroococcopsis gigantea SAG 12.99]